MRRLSRWVWFGLVAQLAAVGCIVGAFITMWSNRIVGACFNCPVDPDPEPYTPADPAPWLFAALVLVIVGTAAFMIAASRRGRA
jgi:hypothetical protein